MSADWVLIDFRQGLIVLKSLPIKLVQHHLAICGSWGENFCLGSSPGGGGDGMWGVMALCGVCDPRVGVSWQLWCNIQCLFVDVEKYVCETQMFPAVLVKILKNLEALHFDPIPPPGTRDFSWSESNPYMNLHSRISYGITTRIINISIALWI